MASEGKRVSISAMIDTFRNGKPLSREERRTRREEYEHGKENEIFSLSTNNSRNTPRHSAREYSGLSREYYRDDEIKPLSSGDSSVDMIEHFDGPSMNFMRQPPIQMFRSSSSRRKPLKHKSIAELLEMAGRRNGRILKNEDEFEMGISKGYGSVHGFDSNVGSARERYFRRSLSNSGTGSIYDSNTRDPSSAKLDQLTYMNSGKDDVLSSSRMSSSGTDLLATHDSLIGTTHSMSAGDQNNYSLTASGVADDLDLALEKFRKQFDPLETKRIDELEFQDSNNYKIESEIMLTSSVHLSDSINHPTFYASTANLAVDDDLEELVYGMAKGIQENLANIDKLKNGEMIPEKVDDEITEKHIHDVDVNDTSKDEEESKHRDLLFSDSDDDSSDDSINFRFRKPKSRVLQYLNKEKKENEEDEPSNKEFQNKFDNYFSSTPTIPESPNSKHPPLHPLHSSRITFDDIKNIRIHSNSSAEGKVDSSRVQVSGSVRDTTESISETLDFTMICLSKRLGYDINTNINNIHNFAESEPAPTVVISKPDMTYNSANPTTNNAPMNTTITNNNHHRHDNRVKIDDQIESKVKTVQFDHRLDEIKKIEPLPVESRRRLPVNREPVVFFEDGYYPVTDFLPQPSEHNASVYSNFSKKEMIIDEDESDDEILGISDPPLFDHARTNKKIRKENISIAKQQSIPVESNLSIRDANINNAFAGDLEALARRVRETRAMVSGDPELPSSSIAQPTLDDEDELLDHSPSYSYPYSNGINVKPISMAPSYYITPREQQEYAIRNNHLPPREALPTYNNNTPRREASFVNPMNNGTYAPTAPPPLRVGNYASISYSNNNDGTTPYTNYNQGYATSTPVPAHFASNYGTARGGSNINRTFYNSDNETSYDPPSYFNPHKQAVPVTPPTHVPMPHGTGFTSSAPTSPGRSYQDVHQTSRSRVTNNNAHINDSISSSISTMTKGREVKSALESYRRRREEIAAKFLSPS